MKKMFMAVIAFMMTLSASAQFYIYFSDGTVAKVDSISMIAPAFSETPGIGTFSVSATKQVIFSPGNLQYTQSTNTWSFAENQYDCLGEANIAIDADILADKVDLFGWSTSTTNFGVSTSTSNSDYSGSFVDWGTNQIGNDAPNTWRTLTYDEWYYLRYTRTNANDLVGVAKVNGVNGLIFLPDNWTCPAGVTFKSGFHSESSVEAYGQYQTFSAEQWAKLEAAGAIFLPAAGGRGGTNVGSVQLRGFYWSATETEGGGANDLSFFSDEAYMGGFHRDTGRSVRLVKDIEGEITTPDKPTEPDTPTEPEEPENTENGHEYVDLGLSVKWATCNVGANKPEEYGDYFAWGEVEPKDTYDWSTYKWCEGSNTSLTKYCTNSDYGLVDNKTTLEAADDAAQVNWGGVWRMPTDAECTELREQCTWTWTTQSGVTGYKVTSIINGNSIFLPAAGGVEGGSIVLEGSYGDFWSSSLSMSYPDYAWSTCFSNASYDRYKGHGSRIVGSSVRPVCP